MSKRMWKIVEIQARKTKIVKEERKRKKNEKRRRRKKRRRNKKEDNRNKKSSREVGNLGQRRKSSKIIGRSEEVGSRTIL